MPDLLKSMFCKLLNHVYSIDSRIENLVLDLLKLIANAYKNNDRGSNHENATSTQHPNVHEVDEEMNSSGSSRRQNLGNSDAQDDVPGSQYEAERATNPSSHIPCANLAQFYSSPSGASDAANNTCKPSTPLPVPKLHRSPVNSTPSNVDNDVIARVMQNLTKNTHFCHNEIKKSDAGPSKIRLDKSDVIMLDKENYYAPDSISPSPKPGMTRFFSKQAASDKDNASPPLSQRRGCSQSFKSPLHLLGIRRLS
ncbi:uncharacterized protein LOC120642467 isoform X3 [Panicum virgatum]|uniref:uncharacterized protein LOC120642467 isoform X3 n=1 Tax=Panicum virgatum TaxID=38727 RepID=UPI0019D69BB4|nr:uncharacterized protein LOC120642467 isoform X3 [Panicum virgatum]